jgi:hypothetical protein
MCDQTVFTDCEIFRPAFFAGVSTLRIIFIDDAQNEATPLQ